MCGIIGYAGHSLLTTHDIPNFINNHFRKVGKITIVHNGIIENYKVLRDILKQSGYKFKSDTDIEVACALIDKLYSEKPDLLCVLEKCLDLLYGSYAFSVICDDDSKSVYATAKDNPLIIGIGENENYLAYDIAEIVKHTNRYILIESNEIAIIKNNQVTVYNRKDNIINKEVLIAD